MVTNWIRKSKAEVDARADKQRIRQSMQWEGKKCTFGVPTYARST